MRVLVYSDVHGNLPAFEKMLKEVGLCDQYISLGDLVNYGPWSSECVELSLSLPNSIWLMGNHEEAFIQGFYPGTNPLVKSFFDQCYRNFKHLDAIKKFESQFLLNGYLFAHTIKDQYIYPDTSIELESNYVIGHSHHQFVYKNNGHILYNAGSVGQNRKYINVINYLLLDTESNFFSLGASTYDVDLLINEMKAKLYPQECVDYYQKKLML